MDTNSRKSVVIMLLILTLVLILPKNTFAVSKDASILNDNGDYIIYIEGLENEEFKFAFSNEEAIENLSYIANWEDTNDINIACIEKNAEIDFSKPVYLFVKVQDEIFNIKLDLASALTKESMVEIENLTKNILVNTEKVVTETRVEDGIKVSETAGQVLITDDKEASYQYQLIKIDGSENPKTQELIGLTNTLQDTYSNLSMYNKIQVATGIYEIYQEIIKDATWNDVEDFKIIEPKDSKEDDKYVVLLKQEKEGNVPKYDVQFLNCTAGEEIKTEKDVKIKNIITALPVTYDSIVLCIVLALAILLTVLVIIRMKNLKNDEKTK